MTRHFCALDTALLMRHRARRVTEIDAQVSDLYADMNAIRSRVGQLYKKRDGLTYPLRYRLKFDEQGVAQVGPFMVQIKEDRRAFILRARTIRCADGTVKVKPRGYATRVVVKRKKATQK